MKRGRIENFWEIEYPISHGRFDAVYPNIPSNHHCFPLLDRLTDHCIGRIIVNLWSNTLSSMKIKKQKISPQRKHAWFCVYPWGQINKKILYRSFCFLWNRRFTSVCWKILQKASKGQMPISRPFVTRRGHSSTVWHHVRDISDQFSSFSRFARRFSITPSATS